jgi:hypothetical protein
MAPSDIIAWECGSCTYTNKGSEPGPCIMCRTERSIRYAIVAGAPAAATARTTTVNCCEQACVLASATSALTAAAASAVMAMVATAPAATADTGEAAAIAQPLMPMAVPNRDTVVSRLVHRLVDIVGTGANNRGCSCIHHKTCGMQVKVGRKVMFRWEKVVYQDQGQEEDTIAVFLVANGIMMCKVGFLPAHLARRVQDYDGLIVHVISIYSDRCNNMVKRQKFWRNKGCCVARILGSRPHLSLYFFSCHNN